MPLIECPACSREISLEAEACPQCGHPNREREDYRPTGPRCYSCSSIATTKCQSCGVLSCVRHLDSIYVQHGRGGGYELRCQSCYSSAMTWKIMGFVLAGMMLLFFFFMMGSR